MSNPSSDRFSIRVKRLRPEARLPVGGSELAAGADLACAEAVTIAPGERRAIPTGLAVEIPPGYYGRVAPRSGLALRHGIDLLAGVIDADYRGEILVLAINLGDQAVSFEPGDRIAQLIIEKAAQATYVWAEDLEQTRRSDGGFGSTGK